MRWLFPIVLVFSSLYSNAQTGIDSLRRSKTGFYYTFQQFQQKKPAVTKPFTIDTINYWGGTDSAITEYTYHFLDSSSNLKNWLFLYDGQNLFEQGNDGTIIQISRIGMFPYQIYVYDAGKTFVIGKPAVMTAAADVVSLLLSSKKMDLYYYNNKGEMKQPNAYGFAKFLKTVDEELYKQFVKEQKVKLKDYIRYLDELNKRYPF
jgi:hypothetical protein